MNIKFVFIVILIVFFSISAVSANDGNQTDGDMDFNKENSECCSFVIQEEDETVFAFRQDSPVNGYGVTIHNDTLDDKEMIVQEIDTPGSHFIHVMLSEDGWFASHGGDSRNISDTRTIEALAGDMILSKNFSNDSFAQIQNIFKKFNVGHFCLKAPDGSYGIAFAQKCIFGKLEPGDYLIIPNYDTGFRHGSYHDYGINPVDAIIEICSFENNGWNRRNVYSYDYKPHDTSDGQKYGVDIYVTDDNGRNVGLNTSKIVSYCYFNDKYFPKSIIPDNPDKLYITTYIFENQSIDSHIEVLNSSDNVFVGSKTPVHYRINNADGDMTVVFAFDDAVEFVDAEVSRGNFSYDSSAHEVKWDLSSSVNAPEITLNVRPKTKGKYSILSHVDGSSEIVNVTGYATDYGVTIKSQDVNTYKTYYKSLDVYLKDNDGVPLVGEKVSIEVNGTVYERTVSPRGYASLAITMQPGEYDALISYDGPFGKNQTTAKITVKKTLFSSDLEEYYGYATFFNVTGLDENGTLLKESSEFNFCIDGTLKDASSNKDGVCAFNISSLKPGRHSIISYNIRTNEIVSNSIYIKEPVCKLSIEKTAYSSKVFVGDIIKWTLTVFNNGPCDAHEVMATDKLQSAFEFVSYNASKGDYDPLSGKWNISYLANGENATLDIYCIALKEGSFTNEANVSCRENNTSSGYAVTVDVDENGEDIIPPEPPAFEPQKTAPVNSDSKKSEESAGMPACGNPITCIIAVFIVLFGSFSIQKRKR